MGNCLGWLYLTPKDQVCTGEEEGLGRLGRGRLRGCLQLVVFCI